MPLAALVVEALSKVMPLAPTVMLFRLSAVPVPVVLMVLPEPVTLTVPPPVAWKPVPLVVSMSSPPLVKLTVDAGVVGDRDAVADAGVQRLGGAGEIDGGAGVAGDADAAAGVVAVVDVAGQRDRAAGVVDDRGRQAGAVADGAAVADVAGAAVDAELGGGVAGQRAGVAEKLVTSAPPSAMPVAPPDRTDGAERHAAAGAAMGDVDRLAGAGDVAVGDVQRADRGAAVVDADLVPTRWW